jgi:hypothetical protein
MNIKVEPAILSSSINTQSSLANQTRNVNQDQNQSQMAAAAAAAAVAAAAVVAYNQHHQEQNMPPASAHQHLLHHLNNPSLSLNNNNTSNNSNHFQQYMSININSSNNESSLDFNQPKTYVNNLNLNNIGTRGEETSNDDYYDEDNDDDTNNNKLLSKQITKDDDNYSLIDDDLDEENENISFNFGNERNNHHDTDLCDNMDDLEDAYEDASYINKIHKDHMHFKQQQQQQQQHQFHQLHLQQNSASLQVQDTKVRKRSANQAYEYLVSLPDSKTFQDWLSTNETDFTWVHKRNSMTNAGKKYYYICNYRIKKGYARCPAVIYALFPNTNDTTVMVYSCGDHEHARISRGSCSQDQIGDSPSHFNNNNNTNNNTNSSSQSQPKLNKQMSNGNLTQDLVSNIINNLQNRQQPRTNQQQPQSFKVQQQQQSSSSRVIQSISSTSSEFSSSTSPVFGLTVNGDNNYDCPTTVDGGFSSNGVGEDGKANALLMLSETDPKQDLLKSESHSQLQVNTQSETDTEQNEDDDDKVEQSFCDENCMPIESVNNNTCDPANQSINLNNNHATEQYNNLNKKKASHQMISEITNDLDLQKESSPLFDNNTSSTLPPSLTPTQFQIKEEQSQQPQLIDERLTTTTHQLNSKQQQQQQHEHRRSSLTSHHLLKQKPTQLSLNTAQKNFQNQLHSNLVDQINMGLNQLQQQGHANNQRPSLISGITQHQQSQISPLLIGQGHGHAQNLLPSPTTKKRRSSQTYDNYSNNIHFNNPLNHQIQTSLNNNNSRFLNNSNDPSIYFPANQPPQATNQYSTINNKQHTKSQKIKHQRKELVALTHLQQANQSNSESFSLYNRQNQQTMPQQSINSYNLSNGYSNQSLNTKISGINNNNNNTMNNNEEVISPTSSSFSGSSGSNGGGSSRGSASSLRLQSLITPLETLQQQQQQHNTTSAKNGMPRVASLSMDNAPVHIDVGGCIYTSSLETLTKFPESRITKMFNGTIPIVLDTLKQHYFIDRDGKTFRHVLNYMRTNRLALPENFNQYESLLDEAKYYELDSLIKLIEEKQQESKLKLNLRISNDLNGTEAAKSSDSELSNSYKSRFHPYGSILEEANLGQMSKAKQTALILKSAFKSTSGKNSQSDVNSVKSISPNNLDECAKHDKLTEVNQSGDKIQDESLQLNTSNTSSTTTPKSVNKPQFKIQTKSRSRSPTNLLSVSQHTTSSPSSSLPVSPEFLISPSNNISTKERHKMLIVNCGHGKVYLSGQKDLIKQVFPQITNNDFLNTDQDYLTRLCLNDLNCGISHLVQLMEHLYDKQFALEAQYAKTVAASDQTNQSFNEYIFVKS